VCEEEYIMEERIKEDAVDESGMVEFLNSVTEHIRWKQARKPVERELRDHILDQREAFEHCGMGGQQALDAAVKEMGDPAKIGASMDRIHKPRMSWTLLSMVVIASLMGIALQTALLIFSHDERNLGGTAFSMLKIADGQISAGILNNQIVYSVIGIVAMLIIRRFDYRRMKKSIPAIAIAFSVFFIVFLHFSQGYNGGRFWIAGIGFNMRILVLLAIPVFAMLVYRYKGEGYGAVIKLLLWAFLFIIFAFRVPAFSSAIILAVSFVILFGMAVAKGWFNVSRKIIFGTMAVIAVLGTLYLSAVLFADSMGSKFMADYQIERLRYIFGMRTAAETEYDYQGSMAEEILNNSRQFGYDQDNLANALAGLPGLGSDYTLVGLTAAFGTGIGIFAALLLFAITIAVMRMSVKQGDDMGKILGAGCGLVLLSETLISVLMALHIIPCTMAVLPFVSQGGSQIFVMYIMMGFVLSIQRYRDLAINEKYDKDEKICTRRIKLLKYKITVEKL